MKSFMNIATQNSNFNPSLDVASCCHHSTTPIRTSQTSSLACGIVTATTVNYRDIKITLEHWIKDRIILLENCITATSLKVIVMCFKKM